MFLFHPIYFYYSFFIFLLFNCIPDPFQEVYPSHYPPIEILSHRSSAPLGSSNHRAKLLSYDSLWSSQDLQN